MPSDQGSRCHLPPGFKVRFEFVSRDVFDECYKEFRGELDSKSILSMAEDAVTYLRRFEAGE